MAKHEFSSENQPLTKRTKNKLTLILEAIREQSLLDTNPETSKEQTEKAVFAFLAKTAFCPTPDTAVLANSCLTALIKKAWPDSKPSCEPIEFKFNRNATPSENASSVLEAVSGGLIAPDIGAMLIGMIKDSIAIHESTELAKRLDELEKSLNKA